MASTSQNLSRDLKNPFGPSTTVPPTSSARDSSKDVTVPLLPELHNPKYLDVLLPQKDVAQPTGASRDDASSQTAAPKAGASFMSALKSQANQQYTQNSAHAYASTLSPTMDAFNGLSQATDVADYEPLLRRSWQEDPLLTLRMIFNLRSIHEGKSEREGFYRAWGWLYRNHPRTAILNLPALVDPLVEKKLKEKKKGKEDGKVTPDEDDGELIDMEEAMEEIGPRGMSHGYWKDLLNLLVLASAGELDDNASKFAALHPERTPKTRPRQTSSGYRGRGGRGRGRGRGSARGRGGIVAQRTQNEAAPVNPAASPVRDEERSAQAKAERDEAHKKARANIEKLFTTSNSFKALYIATARLFAAQLEADVKNLERIADSATDDKTRISLSFQFSLAAKYAPSMGGSHDRSTNIASAIAELLCATGKLRIPNEQTTPGQLSLQQVQNMRIAYTRWVLSPLRRFLQIPEIFMSAGRWGDLPYKRVASKCMQNNKKLFFKHDEKRFSKYLLDVAEGKRSISGGTLLPHSLLEEAFAIRQDSTDPAVKAERMVIEGQWKTMIEQLKLSGTLDNSMAICDVSGSMGYIQSASAKGTHVSPILPAVALSIVLAQVSSEPWANNFITFSATPEIVAIDPTAGLVETANMMVATSWGMNTDFNAVFTKLLLPMAIKHGVKKEDFIKRLFVFSDMEFDQSYRGYNSNFSWTTEHQKIASEFEKAGYDLPEIVYWNLQGARGAKPALADTEGVSMMSGFSSNMLKTFMDEGTLEETEEVETEEVVEEGDEVVVVKKTEKKKLTPEDRMRQALNKASFRTLVVED